MIKKIRVPEMPSMRPRASRGRQTLISRSEIRMAIVSYTLFLLGRYMLIILDIQMLTLVSGDDWLWVYFKLTWDLFESSRRRVRYLYYFLSCHSKFDFIRPMIFFSEFATNASAHGVGVALYSGNNDALIAHRGTESSSLLGFTNSLLTFHLTVAIQVSPRIALILATDTHHMAEHNFWWYSRLYCQTLDTVVR